jgi:hypothetical protein
LGIPPPEPAEPSPVQALVAAYVQAIETDGGLGTTSMRSAIGSNVKRILRDDPHIPLPVILQAVEIAGTKRSRTLDPFLGDAQQRFGRSEPSRRAMFARWEAIASSIDSRRDAS